MSNWKQHKQYAEDVTSAHQPDFRGDCPFCGGRGTFTAHREAGTLQYNCYKLGCDVSGVFDTEMSAYEVMQKLRPAHTQEKKEQDTMVIPEYVVDPLPEHGMYHSFVKKWSLQGERLMYDIKDHRVVFPIYHKGRIIDATGRAVAGAIPKWYRYTGKADYFIKGDARLTNTLVVVEDILSAVTVYSNVDNVTTMAILGTNFSKSIIDKCGEFNRIIIALDPDAHLKTIEYKRQVQTLTGVPTYGLMLKDDLKYGHEEDYLSLQNMMSN